MSRHFLCPGFYGIIVSCWATRSLVTPNQTKINDLPVHQSASLWQYDNDTTPIRGVGCLGGFKIFLLCTYVTYVP
jgi:hypothetical protein